MQQTWQAVSRNIQETVQNGRGFKIPGLCIILPSIPGSPAAATVLVSDKLLQMAPQLQLGRGCVHHASVKQQVQGVDTLNTAKLMHK